MFELPGLKWRSDIIGRFSPSSAHARIVSSPDLGDESALYLPTVAPEVMEGRYALIQTIPIQLLRCLSRLDLTCRLPTNLLRSSVYRAQSPQIHNTHDRAPSELAIGIHRLAADIPPAGLKAMPWIRNPASLTTPRSRFSSDTTPTLTTPTTALYHSYTAARIANPNPPLKPSLYPSQHLLGVPLLCIFIVYFLSPPCCSARLWASSALSWL